MKLRTKYILFVVILHLVTLVLTYFIFKEDKPLFIVAEAFIILSMVIAWNLYRQLIQPLKTLMDGMSAIRDQDFNVKFLPTGKHEVDQLIGVYNQMIDQLRLERTKQEQQHFFLEKLIYTSPTGIIILDFDEQIQQVNPRALQILNLEEKELLNQQIADLDNTFFRYIATLRTGETKTVKLNGAETYKIQRSHFIDRGFARSFIMLEELTTEILIAEKNAYGKVIRMMAHEVNNTIGPVNSIIQSALRSKGLWKEEDGLLREALQVAADRNQNLNLFMRNFADLVKLPEPNKKRLDLHHFIRSIVALMALRLGEKEVELLVDIPDEPFYILADEQQMEQALINVLKNAAEAIEGKGTIILRSIPAAKQLVITDTGKGISPETEEKLFTPFFSTKKDGQGIGLTLVREILMNHNFTFSLKTVGEKRTEFCITF
ncbi:HAMP domain-containing protein [Flavihumibacter sp. R14]|nr:HAMP domain-containing protein [Flavihumibacter soli]